MRSLFLLITVWCVTSHTNAQYKEMLHRSYADKVDLIGPLYKDIFELKDSTAIAAEVQKIKAFAKKHHDKELELEMDLLWGYYLGLETNTDQTVVINNLNKTIDNALEIDARHIQYRALRVLGKYNWYTLKNYEQAFNYFKQLDALLKQTNQRDYPDIVSDLSNIGLAYYFFQDYETAKVYFERILTFKENEFNTLAVSAAKNTIGLYYQRLKDYKTSDTYFSQILESPFEATQYDWGFIAKGNLGKNLYLQKMYDEALPLLIYGYNEAMKHTDYGFAAGALISISDLYLQKKNYDRSWEYVQLAQKYITLSGQKERYRILYPIISNWHSAVGQQELAQSYLDSTIMALEDYHQSYSGLKILRVEQTINQQNQELAKAQIEIEKTKKITQRNIMLLIISLLCISIVLYSFYQKKQTAFKTLQLKLTAQKLQMASKELEMAQLKLKNFSKTISDKNAWIEKLKKQNNQKQHSDIIKQLQQSTILTDQDWVGFQKLFDEVYPGLILKTKETYPMLSTAELRYLLLSKLQLNYRETAIILGVSPNTIQVTKHRIRKKLNLQDNDFLGKII